MISRHELAGFSDQEINEIDNVVQHNLRLSGDNFEAHPLYKFHFIDREHFIFKDAKSQIFYEAVRKFPNYQALVKRVWEKDIPEHLRRRSHIEIWEGDRLVQVPTTEELETLVLQPSLSPPGYDGIVENLK